MTVAGRGIDAVAGSRALGALLRSRAAADRRARPDTGPGAEAVHIPSRPETVVWGHIPADRSPVAIVDTGARLRVDTVSHQGMLTSADPVAFFAEFGIPADEVLRDVVDIHARVQRPDGASGHVLTGPIHVSGAEDGDVLEVGIVAADLRVGYGVNHSEPGMGVLPDLLDRASTRLVRTDPATDRLVFGEGVSIPAAPFPGIVTLAPPDGSGLFPSRPPHRCGGNLDLKELTAGSRLFLPVTAPGAQLYLGDPHSAQGDGEVNGTAVEHSSSYTVDVTLHKGLHLGWPVAESPTHLIPMGVHAELSGALDLALGAAIELLGGLTDGRLSHADAYALCSLAVDFSIAEAVNGNTVVHAKVPKSIFEMYRS